MYCFVRTPSAGACVDAKSIAATGRTTSIEPSGGPEEGPGKHGSATAAIGWQTPGLFDCGVWTISHPSPLCTSNVSIDAAAHQVCDTTQLAECLIASQTSGCCFLCFAYGPARCEKSTFLLGQRCADEGNRRDDTNKPLSFADESAAGTDISTFVQSQLTADTQPSADDGATLPHSHGRVRVDANGTAVSGRSGLFSAFLRDFFRTKKRSGTEPHSPFPTPASLEMAVVEYFHGEWFDLLSREVHNVESPLDGAFSAVPTIESGLTYLANAQGKRTEASRTELCRSVSHLVVLVRYSDPNAESHPSTGSTYGVFLDLAGCGDTADLVEHGALSKDEQDNLDDSFRQLRLKLLDTYLASPRDAAGGVASATGGPEAPGVRVGSTNVGRFVSPRALRWGAFLDVVFSRRCTIAGIFCLPGDQATDTAAADVMKLSIALPRVRGNRKGARAQLISKLRRNSPPHTVAGAQEAHGDLASGQYEPLPWTKKYSIAASLLSLNTTTRKTSQELTDSPAPHVAACALPAVRVAGVKNKMGRTLVSPPTRALDSGSARADSQRTSSTLPSVSFRDASDKQRTPKTVSLLPSKDRPVPTAPSLTAGAKGTDSVGTGTLRSSRAHTGTEESPAPSSVGSRARSSSSRNKKSTSSHGGHRPKGNGAAVGDSFAVMRWESLLEGEAQGRLFIEESESQSWQLTLMRAALKGIVSERRNEKRRPKQTTRRPDTLAARASPAGPRRSVSSRPVAKDVYRLPARDATPPSRSKGPRSKSKSHRTNSRKKAEASPQMVTPLQPFLVAAAATHTNVRDSAQSEAVADQTSVPADSLACSPAANNALPQQRTYSQPRTSDVSSQWTPAEDDELLDTRNSQAVPHHRSRFNLPAPSGHEPSSAVQNTQSVPLLGTAAESATPQSDAAVLAMNAFATALSNRAQSTYDSAWAPSWDDTRRYSKYSAQQRRESAARTRRAPSSANLPELRRYTLRVIADDEQFAATHGGMCGTPMESRRLSSAVSTLPPEQRLFPLVQMYNDDVRAQEALLGEELMIRNQIELKERQVRRQREERFYMTKPSSATHRDRGSPELGSLDYPSLTSRLAPRASRVFFYLDDL